MSTPTSAAELAYALGGRSTGKGKWQACCPSHNDKHPSLSIKETPEGTILVHCRSGCRQDQVIGSLQEKGLWPKKTSRWAEAHPGLTWEQVEHAKMVLFIARCDKESHRDALWTAHDWEDYKSACAILALVRKHRTRAPAVPGALEGASVVSDSVDEDYAPR